MPFNSALGSRGNFDPANMVLSGIPAIAASTTIAPQSLITRLTGTTNVATITPPDPYFYGPLYLLSTDASPFATVTTGNIQLATTVVRYKVLALMYDPSTSKWYPSY